MEITDLASEQVYCGNQLEIKCIDNSLEEHQSRGRTENIIMYTIPTTAVGTVFGFLGGLLSYAVTGDPMSMAYGPSIGAAVGSLAGILSAEHIEEAEIKRLEREKQNLLNQDNS